MWIVTFIPRWLGFRLGHIELPPFWLSFLKYVPISVFTALLVPDVVNNDEGLFRAIACLFAGFIMWRTKSLFMCILTGFSVYWILRLTFT